ncbi:MAG: ABC transporter permease subunit [Alphaproteobacteria bacterium]|nr:ABC transporter permease subunit [Alphaproteobacteria bacterium]
MSPARLSRGTILAFAGVAPFALFAFLFLLLPTAKLLVGAFQDPAGNFTLGNIVRLFTPSVIASFRVSIIISGASAILGAAVGLAVALALRSDAVPRVIRQAVLTLSGVTSNFAGVPLAFAFLATLGRTGLVTALLKTVFGIDIYADGFNLFSITGLTFTYLYFQMPLMVLVIMPAVEGLKRDWAEAAAMLGASPLQYTLRIVAPVLAPNVIGAALLLFANAFGAVATAFALTGSSINLVTILLFAQIRGDVLHDPNLGFALALGMVVVTGLCNVAYLRLRAFSDRRMR